MKRLLTLAATATLLLAPTACGVPTEDHPRPPERTRTVRQPAPATPAAAASGAAVEKLYLVRDGALVAVQRRLPTEPDPQRLLTDLFAGPTTAEQDHGLSSALIGSDAAVSVQVVGTTAIVELPTATEGTGRNDDVLAFGQIVCTLTARAEISEVVFTRQGQRLGVPRPDAPLTQEPLRPSDYASLIAGDATPTPSASR